MLRKSTLYREKHFIAFDIIDNFNRELLHAEIGRSIMCRCLIHVFALLRLEGGLPGMLRTQNGPEFLSREFAAWAEPVGKDLQYIQAYEPDQNAYTQRFNRTYRTEMLELYPLRSA